MAAAPDHSQSHSVLNGSSNSSGYRQGADRGRLRLWRHGAHCKDDAGRPFHCTPAVRPAEPVCGETSEEIRVSVSRMLVMEPAYGCVPLQTATQHNLMLHISAFGVVPFCFAVCRGNHGHRQDDADLLL